MTSSSELTGVGQIAIRTHDLARAVAFYRDTLGLEYLFETPTLGFLMCGDVRLMLAEPETPEVDHPSSVIYFRVDDIDTAYSELGRCGVAFEEKPHVVARMPDHELWMAFFRDPDRNLLGLMSEVRSG